MGGGGDREEDLQLAKGRETFSFFFSLLFSFLHVFVLLTKMKNSVLNS